jgi:hypothetical protein
MTRNQILKLRPRFKPNENSITMIDWFEICYFSDAILIKSGLRHADGETKSLFNYSRYYTGRSCEKRAFKEFEEWWNELNYKNK